MCSGLYFGVHSLFDGFGELGRTYRTVDWAATPLGPVSAWSETLLNVVDLVLNTRFPITLLWGSGYALLYNEAYIALIADKHPAALGRPAREVFPEAWELIGPMMNVAMSAQEATWVVDQYVPLYRRGFLEECYFTFSYSPVRNRDGVVEGVMDIAAETTEQVISRRRLHLLSELTERLADVDRVEDVPRTALPLLCANTRDFPAVDIRIAGLTGGEALELPSRPRNPPNRTTEVIESTGECRLAWLPLASAESEERSWLVVSLSPLLAPDENYLGFLRLVAASVGQALDRVRARTAERRTAETQRSMFEAFQRSLLPRPPDSRSPQVAVRYQPAAELAQVGGDWYDLFELSDASLAVVIGDVAGHDQRAAAAMAEVRNISRGVAYTLNPNAPSRILQGIDRAMQGVANEIVATAVLAQVRGVDADALTLTWSNAGHPPPVLIQPDGSTRLLETPPELMLGLDHTTPRTDHSLSLPSTATVVFYTDGLVERRGAALSEGLTWLVKVLEHREQMEVEELCDYILSSAAAVEDDVALLVLRA